MLRPLLCLPILLASAMPVLAQTDLASLEKQVKKLHLTAQGDRCRPVEEAYHPDEAYEVHELEWTPDYEGAEPEKIVLFRLFCDLGAYNVLHAYYWQREFEGLQPLHFATPTFDTEYENDDGIDGKLLSVTLTGMTTANVLINSAFNPATATVTAHSYWRGLGDASSDGTWIFDQGQFTLSRYDVDASYDDQVNPETLIDYATNR